MLKLDLEKAEEPEIKLPTSVGLWKSRRIPGEGGKSTPVSTTMLNVVV